MLFHVIFATFAIFAEAVMDFLVGITPNIPALRNLLVKEPEKLLFGNKKGLECVSPLLQSVEATPEPLATAITGTIPQWICGSFLRVGPGKFEFGSDKYNHWFDGMALLHQFKIEQGIVTYMSKFLESESYLTNQSKNRIVVSEFGTLAMPDPCKTMYERFMSTFNMEKVTDNDNVNYVCYKGDYYVSTESNFIHKIDPKTLETKEKVDWSKYIAVNSATAHPHYEPDGTVYNMGNSYGTFGSSYNIIRIPPQKVDSSDTIEGAQVVCSIGHKDKLKPSYYHSFGMTENYIIFVEQPLKMDLLKIITHKISGKTVADSLTWAPEENTYFHIANKLSGKLIPVQYCAKGFTTFHQINAYEDQGCIVFDICCQDRGDGVHRLTLQNMRQSGETLDEVYNSLSTSFPRRFVLPLAVNEDTLEGVNISPLSYTSATAVKRSDGSVWCTYEKLYDDVVKDIGGLDFPSINYANYNAKKYRFFYGVGIGHLVGDSLIKMDVETKMAKVWKETSFYPSEPVFVPLPDASAEDEGVILSVVVTPNQKKSAFLLVLDAGTFAEIGRAEVQVQIPSGFHGVFAAN